MSQKNSIIPLVISIVDVTEITAATWTAFDTDGLEGACFFLRITNDSDTDVIISYDGITGHEYVPKGKTIEVNFQTNSSPGNYVAKVKKGTVLYAQGTAGQSGYIYLAGYFHEQ